MGRVAAAGRTCVRRADREVSADRHHRSSGPVRGEIQGPVRNSVDESSGLKVGSKRKQLWNQETKQSKAHRPTGRADPSLVDCRLSRGHHRGLGRQRATAVLDAATKRARGRRKTMVALRAGFGLSLASSALWRVRQSSRAASENLAREIARGRERTPAVADVRHRRPRTRSSRRRDRDRANVISSVVGTPARPRVLHRRHRLSTLRRQASRCRGNHRRRRDCPTAPWCSPAAAARTERSTTSIRMTPTDLPGRGDRPLGRSYTASLYWQARHPARIPPRKPSLRCSPPELAPPRSSRHPAASIHR